MTCRCGHELSEHDTSPDIDEACLYCPCDAFRDEREPVEPVMPGNDDE